VLLDFPYDRFWPKADMTARHSDVRFKTNRSGEWPKNITIRILLSLKLFIEVRPQYPGSIHYSVCGEKGVPCRLGGRVAWGVLYVELGRRDVHHDGRACRRCSFLHRDVAVVNVTLSTFSPLR
jgi:hypothetical protein